MASSGSAEPPLQIDEAGVARLEHAFEFADFAPRGFHVLAEAVRSFSTPALAWVASWSDSASALRAACSALTSSSRRRSSSCSALARASRS
ncbi:MAG: hypothetical protein U1F87_02075 [Kiritimatiellia bacterium]